MIVPVNISSSHAREKVLIFVPIFREEIAASGTSKSISIGSILSSDVITSPGSRYSPILLILSPIIPSNGALMVFLSNLFLAIFNAAFAIWSWARASVSSVKS